MRGALLQGLAPADILSAQRTSIIGFTCLACRFLCRDVGARASHNGIDSSRPKILPSLRGFPCRGSKGKCGARKYLNAAAVPATISGESCVLRHWEPRPWEGGRRGHCATPPIQGNRLRRSCRQQMRYRALPQIPSRGQSGYGLSPSRLKTWKPSWRAGSETHQERHSGKWSIGS